MNITQIITKDQKVYDVIVRSGEEIRKSLLKSKSDGTYTVVPPCDVATYPILLQQEIDSAESTIDRPSFGKSILTGIVIMVLFGMYGHDVFGNMDFTTYWVGQASILFGSVGNYIMSHIYQAKRKGHLSEIRSLLMEDYINKYL